MKESCKSLVELEFFLEEVCKATTDQLDWINPKGQQYPHNLLKPLPLIPNSRGRRVIPFDYFINNDLEYLCGGASSRKYTTSVTKTKAADYGHIKDDAKLYKFKEGDFKRLRIQDIKDMLLLLVQGKLTNLTVEERFAFNVSLRMFTRSIVIQRHVEDLQLAKDKEDHEKLGEDIKEMLKKFGLEDSKPTKTPMSTEIKLTKDDEADSVDSFKYRENPKTTHLEAVKHIFRYIRGTSHLGLWYPKGTKIETVVYADSNHAGDYIDRKNTSSVCTFMGCFLTSWFAKKQTALAISTTKAEYVFAGEACQQALWMKQALIDYNIRLDNFRIMCENKGAIDLSKNSVQHSRTKHIEIRHHFLRDNIQKGNISIEKVASKDNIADIFTKHLKREVFNYLRFRLGMMELIMDSDPSSSQK
nr:hypothetical protein [Tanacetum cinerariifolium]